ncbi:MAG: hypothetical protein PF572_05615 [Patescibacteria group bacterium]|jgi:restriction endonuclease S subunit|nr:hypothetical protein [Patescibacteria group bacterium]
MKLLLDSTDLKKSQIDVGCSSSCFDDFNESAQKAILAVGKGTFYRNHGTDLKNYNVIYPPKKTEDDRILDLVKKLSVYYVSEKRIRVKQFNNRTIVVHANYFNFLEGTLIGKGCHNEYVEIPLSKIKDVSIY